MSTPLSAQEPQRAVRPRARPLASRAAFGFGTGIALGIALGCARLAVRPAGVSVLGTDPGQRDRRVARSRVHPRRVGQDRADRCAARPHRAAQRRRRVLPADLAVRGGLPADRGAACRHHVGSGGADRRPDLRRGRRRLASLAGNGASPRGGRARRFAHRRGRGLRRAPARATSAASCCSSKWRIGLVVPFALLRPGERLIGYVATGLLALAIGVAIEPIFVLVRSVADRF